jgi:nicotinamidase/pyrazinamidase
MKSRKALLIVDVQNDFCPKGALAVPRGDKVVPVLNKYIKIFSQNKLSIFASRDWHPKQTKHFKDFGGLWPKHCIQKTKGAKFHPGLKLPQGTIILSKGMNPGEDSYSAFQAVDNKRVAFFKLLKKFGINELFVGGLATDYCVKFSVLDALKLRFKVKILTDAIQGVNIKAADSQKAIKEMLAAGVQKINFKKFSKK